MVAALSVFVVLFSFQMGWLPGGAKKDPVLWRSNTPPPVSVAPPRKEAAPLPPEQIDQQLRAAQIKVTTLSVELDALRMQRSEAMTEATRLSNVLARVTLESDAFRKQAATALEEAKAEILARSRRIEVLEGEIGSLTQQLRDLAERLGRQDVRIAETERKMASSETERVALKATLEALQAERRILEARFNAKESMLAEVKKQRDSESAARDSLFRRNWLAKSKAAEAAKQGKAPASKPSVSKPGTSKVRVDVSEIPSPRGKSSGKTGRTNAPTSSISSGKAR